MLTIAWMTVECSVGLGSAYSARSIALLAFGSDSFVELLSATVVVLQFVPVAKVSERLAARLSAMLLFVLAMLLAVISAYALKHGSPVDVSARGIAVTAGALLIMPVLGALKRKTANRVGNRALAADAVQSATCAYLAAVTLLSLVANAVFGVQWLDAVAGMMAIPILIVEGQRAWRGEQCGCC